MHENKGLRSVHSLMSGGPYGKNLHVFALEKNYVSPNDFII